MISVENFKSFEVTVDAISRLHRKIATDLTEYQNLMQEAHDLLQLQMEISKSEKDELLELIKMGEKSLETRKNEKNKLKSSVPTDE